MSGPAQITDAAQALAHLARTHGLPVLAAVDTDDPHLLAALGLDITITLTRDTDQIHATITERDLGQQATLALHADLAHARITDPANPYASPTTPAPQTPPPRRPRAPTPPHRPRKHPFKPPPAPSQTPPPPRRPLPSLPPGNRLPAPAHPGAGTQAGTTATTPT